MPHYSPPSKIFVNLLCFFCKKAIVHRNKQRAQFINTRVYGLVTDSDEFRFWQINNEGKVGWPSSMGETNKQNQKKQDQSNELIWGLFCRFLRVNRIFGIQGMPSQ